MFPFDRNLNSFTICFWNANELRLKAIEFRDFVYNNNLDIVLVSETHLSQGQTVKIANYENFFCTGLVVAISLEVAALPYQEGFQRYFH